MICKSGTDIIPLLLFTFAENIFNQKFITAMGRGDNRTKRGKITTGSFGVSRPKKARNAKAKRA